MKNSTIISFALALAAILFASNPVILKLIITLMDYLGINNLPIIRISYFPLLLMLIFGVFLFALSTYARFEEHKIDSKRINEFYKFLNLFIYLSNWSIPFFAYLIMLLVGLKFSADKMVFDNYLSFIFYLTCVNYIFLGLVIVHIWIIAPFKDDYKIKRLLKDYYRNFEDFTK